MIEHLAGRAVTVKNNFEESMRNLPQEPSAAKKRRAAARQYGYTQLDCTSKYWMQVQNTAYQGRTPFPARHRDALSGLRASCYGRV
jgi:hypothetical protein